MSASTSNQQTGDARVIALPTTSADGGDRVPNETQRRLELLTVDALADLLKVRKSWIYDEVESGRLPALRLGRQLRFRPDAIAGFLDGATRV